jgi:phosphohistidine swiveling domain-containing protein
VQQAGEGDDARRLQEARAHRVKSRRAFDVLHKRLQRDDALLAKVAEVIHEYVWLRTERIDVLKKALVCSGEFFRWIERMNNWEFGCAVHTTRDELYGVLRGEVNLDPAELRARHKDGYVAHITPERTRVITDPEEQKKFIAEHLGTHDWRAEKEVCGQVACKGVVRARVRVMFHTNEHSKMQPGEILIANMTHPDYMPAIRKASAIVTDEGGIVCHAAVISRELKIPCVIGTANATKIFHDGDFVEVDAVNGVVRKIVE